MENFKCKNPNCHRIGLEVVRSTSGERVISTRNRHDSEKHKSEYSLAEILAIYSPEEIEKALANAELLRG